MAPETWLQLLVVGNPGQDAAVSFIVPWAIYPIIAGLGFAHMNWRVGGLANADNQRCLATQAIAIKDSHNQGVGMS